MKVVTVQEMRELEERSAREGITTDTLMENAGRAVAQALRQERGGVVGCPIVVLVGPGNNGGDGLVAARYLHQWGARVRLYLATPRNEDDPNLQSCRTRGISFADAANDPSLAILDEMLRRAEVVVDAVLGTGKARPIEGALKGILEGVRRAKDGRPRLLLCALDLPSGLDADSGAVDPATLAADLTITLAYPKRGLFAFPGAPLVGKLLVVDIGIPEPLARGIAMELITPSWMKAQLPPRPASANKGAFGRVMVVAGSANYTGAAYLACMAAARSGAGLVTLAAARSLHPIFATKLTEATHLPLPEVEPDIVGPEARDILLKGLADYHALLVGCGLGQNPATTDFIRALLLKKGGQLPPLILDADALNALAHMPDWWLRLESPAILTPHPGEMARLLNTTVAQVQADRIEVAQQAARRWQATVVLKGAYTVIAAADGKAYLSPFANPGLASAGTGDVLAGAIAGFLAQGLEPPEAACCGVYIHGAAGEAVREQMGDAGMIASDLLPRLPQVIKQLKA